MPDIDPTKPEEGTAPNRADLRNNLLAIKRRIGTMTETFANLAGRPVLVRSDEDGPNIPEGDVPMHGGGIGVRGFRPYPIELVGSTPLTEDADFGHLGAVCYYYLPGAIVLSVTYSPDPVVGITTGFACTIYRGQGAGLIQLQINDPIINDRIDGLSGIDEGGAITIVLLPGNRLLVQGAVI